MKAAALSYENSRKAVPYETWMTVLLAAGVWFILINQLRIDWTVNAQYSFGWLVPLLTLYLLWERWKDAPPPGARVAAWLLAAAAAFLAFAIFPLRLILEASPDWRQPDWALAVAVVGLSFVALLYAGGWPWLKHFGFPVAFFFVAVPWPAHLENIIMQHLMRNNAFLSVQALMWCGLYAVQMGNVIQISSGSVGIDEACSGVRSLQTTLMISLFLGEMYRFNIGRRLLLVATAGFFAFICNLGRTYFLVWMSASRGIQEMTKWHDTAGLTVLILCVAGLWQMARLFQPQNRRTSAASPDASAPVHLQVGRRLPGAALTALALWLVFSEGAVEFWYRLHEWNRPANLHWTVAFPTAAPHFEETEMPEVTRNLLRYDEGHSARWTDDEGIRWSMFFFRWLPGRASAQLARSHKPEICLPAAGLTLEEYLGTRTVAAGPVTLPFQAYIFSYQGRPLHVFYCLWEDSQEQNPKLSTPKSGKEAVQDTLIQWQSSTRIHSVLEGKRSLGQQTLEIALSGYETEDEAFAALKKELAAIIKP